MLGGLIAAGGAISLLFSGFYGMNSTLLPPLAVAAAAIAVSAGGVLLAWRHERAALFAFALAWLGLAAEAAAGLVDGFGSGLPASPLESASFALLAGAGVIGALRRRRLAPGRIRNSLARAAALWALALAGVGLAGRLNFFTSEADTHLDNSATWWGWAVAVLVGLCLLSCTDRSIRVRSARDDLRDQVALAAWIVVAPIGIAQLMDVVVATMKPATALAVAGWITLLLCAFAALIAAALNWVVADLELARVRNASADGTIVVDHSSKIVYVDDSACQLFGWRSDELVGQPLEVVIPARFRNSHQHRTNEYLKHPEHRSMGMAATVGLRRDGSEFEAEVVLAPVDGGQLVSAAIWEVKGMRLKRRETRFRDRLVAVIEQSSQGFFIENAAGMAMEANDALCNMLGYSRDELLGTSIVNRCDPAELATVDQAVLNMIKEGGDHATWRARYSRRDGSTFWADVEVTRLVNDQGRIQGVAGQLRDVSAEIEERERRVAAEGLLAAATEAAPIGLAVTTLDGMHQQVNRAYCEMTGYSEVELLTRSVRAITEPEDWPHEESCRARLRVADPAEGTAVEVFDKRLLRPDGSTIWVRKHLGLLRSDDGVPTAFVSQTFDVSEEKRAADAARQAQAELAYRSSHDSLTGVRNRANIIEVLTEMLATSDGGNVGLLFLDLDRFKQINDDISHAAGDDVLIEVANRLRGATRANDHIGRIGGDEFIVVLGDLTSPADAAAVAEHIRGCISSRDFTADAVSVNVTASMGIAVSRPGQTAAELLHDADAALQLAKESGRDGAKLHDDALRNMVARRKETAKLLKRAVADGLIDAWFQPIVDLTDRSVVGLEAVARWVEPGGAPVRAVDFIDVAEESGVLIELGIEVIGQALTHLSALPDSISMAVNVATVQLQRPALRRRVTALLGELEILPRRLVLEVAEASLLELRAQARRDLEELVELGVRLHVGGFGVGASSLAQLRDFPVTGVKLDRSIVRRLGPDRFRPMARLASGLASMAEEFGLTRVAEGIETEEQAAAALAAGWPLGQGWLFGKPAPAPELVAGKDGRPPLVAHVVHDRRRSDGGVRVATPRAATRPLKFDQN